MKSKFLRLNLSDGIKGLILAVITALVTGVYELLLSGGGFTWETLKPMLLTAAAAGLSYIIKNFLTNNEGKMLTKDRPGIRP
jgi:hypothetical protein